MYKNRPVTSSSLRMNFEFSFAAISHLAIPLAVNTAPTSQYIRRLERDGNFVDFDNGSIFGPSVTPASRSVGMFWSIDSSFTNPFELVSFRRGCRCLPSTLTTTFSMFSELERSNFTSPST